MNIKDGIKTTEFYLTVATLILGLLVAFGVITQVEADEIKSLIVVVLGAAGPMAGAIVSVVEYIRGRNALKLKELEK